MSLFRLNDNCSEFSQNYCNYSEKLPLFLLNEERLIGKIETIVGGGDTVAVLNDCGVFQDMTYVSTGGGAFLEFIEGKELPGISVLKK